MTPEQFLLRVIDPAVHTMEQLFEGPKVSNPARVMMLCIALQEVGQSLIPRYQNSPDNSPGPARGRWQFEQGGAATNVLSHNACKGMMSKACAYYEVAPNPGALWRAIEGHDFFACCCARAQLYTDPNALPTTEQAGWACYQRMWRPGKPHPETWPANWDVATKAVQTHPWEVLPAPAIDPEKPVV